ncbi:MAG: molybdopterin oxidoreductase family protein [Vicinamibacterales bacterium]
MNYAAGVCNLCGTGCGHFLRTEGGRIVGVAPSTAHPVSQGRLCVRGWHIHEVFATGGRLLSPMVREGGALRPASYAEALSVLRDRLTALPEPARQLAVIGSARSSNEDNFLLARLAREVFGTSQLGVTSQGTHGRTMQALEAAFGEAAPIGSLADVERARYLLLVGGDLARLNPIVGANVHRAALAGGRVVALTSTRTQMARLATRHLQQRPGTKTIAVNGLLKALLAARSAQPGFAAPALPGYRELERSLAALSPGAIESATGISYAELEEESRRLLESESFLVIFPSGISGLDAETINTIVDLAAVSGKMGTKNSGILPITGICNLQGSFDVGLVPEGSTDPLGSLMAQRSPLRALFVVDHDDGVIRHRERIAGLEFVAYVGSFVNPFMELADVVLPAATFVESDGTFTASDGRVQLSPSRVEPPAGVMPAWRLFARIAAGFGSDWDYETGSDVFAAIASSIRGYAGLSHELLSVDFGRHVSRAAPVRCQRLLPIDTGKAAVGKDAAFPFALMIGKAQHFWHQHNLMRRTLIPRREYDATLLQYPRGYVEISAADAKRLQVRDKSPVELTSPAGSMRTAVKVSDDVQEGSACVPYFINETISGFLVAHEDAFTSGEDAVIPVRIEKL